MPNWVQNEIRFDDSVSEELLKRMQAELASDEESDDDRYGSLDFNKLIPMPKSLNIESSTSQGDAACLYMTAINPAVTWYNRREKVSQGKFEDLKHKLCDKLRWKPHIDDLSKMFELTEEYIAQITKYDDQEKMLIFGEAVCRNLYEYGVADWYEWCCRYWGTKWNACQTYWEGRCLSFQTAWSAPHPILEALSKKYGVAFTHQWADEDIGNNCGECWYDGEGGYIEEDIGEDTRRFALGVWDYDEDEIEEYLSEDEEDELDDEPKDCGEPETVDSGISISDLI